MNLKINISISARNTHDVSLLQIFKPNSFILRLKIGQKENQICVGGISLSVSEQLQIKFLLGQSEVAGAVKVHGIYAVHIHENFAEFVNVNWRRRNVVNVSFKSGRVNLNFVVEVFQFLVVNQSCFLNFFFLFLSSSGGSGGAVRIESLESSSLI